MRTRRQLIKVGGTAAAVGVAGCLEEIPEEEDDEPVDDEEQDDDEEADEEEMDEEEEEVDEEEEEEEEEAVFEVSSVEAPSEVEIGVDFTWSFEVENTGDADGTFESSVTRSRGGGPHEEIDTVSRNVPAGETRTETVPATIDFLGSYRYRLEETGDEFGVTANEREISFGESYVNPDGVSVTVSSTRRVYDIELTRSYTYTDESGRDQLVRAGSNKRFALVSVESSRETRNPMDLPRRDEFLLVVGDEEYAPIDRLDDDEYEGGDTRSRNRSGVVMFEIDDRFDRSDQYEVYWVRNYDEGTAEAIWST